MSTMMGRFDSSNASRNLDMTLTLTGVRSGVRSTIDVAKAGMDIAVRPTDERWSISNDEAGIRQLVSRLKTLEPDIVVLEASGGLELPLVATLAVEELPVVVVNPRQVRDFARATGKLAKTDTLDAAVLAHFGEAVRPPVRPLRDSEAQLLHSLVARRHQQVKVASVVIGAVNAAAVSPYLYLRRFLTEYVVHLCAIVWGEMQVLTHRSQLLSSPRCAWRLLSGAAAP